MKKIILISLIAASLSLTSCQSSSLTKQQQGAAIGGVVGAVIGSRFGHGAGRRVAAIVGGFLGVYLGQLFGAHLDEKDRIALLEQAQQTLDNENAETATWESEESDASATINTSEAKSVEKNINIIKIKKVETQHNMTLIGQDYKAIKSANIRYAPTTDSEISGGLPVNSTFTAVGKTENNWIMVAKNNVTIGYVYAPLVSNAEKYHAVISEQAINLDNIELTPEDAQEFGINLDDIEIDQEIVAANTTCKDLNIDIINAEGKNKIEKFEACKRPDGAWEIL